VLRKLAALVIAPALLLGAAGLTRAAAAGDTNAASFVGKANSERQARGLRAYVVKSDLAAVATRHSQRMAEQGRLYHNPNLGSDVSGWQIVGENVGNGGSVESIHQAFMDSRYHRENILATDYTEIGVGTVTDEQGVIWVTQVFRKPEAAAPAPAKVTAPITTQASRSVARVPVKAAAVAPVTKPVAKAPARPARTTVAVRPDASAFLTALAPTRAAAVRDPFTLALAYTETLAALTR
jgi:hypothetical protein